MLKRDMVWRHLADEVLTRRTPSFHQSEIAQHLGMSLGNVNLALEPLRAIGAVEVVGKNLIVRDVKKILLLWGARRAQPQLIGAYEAFEQPRELVRLLPPGLTLTSFAAFVVTYRSEPAPMSAVRAYAPAFDAALGAELRRRFMPAATPERAVLFVYAADEILAAARPPSVGPAQLYVDLWNEGDFFAADYLRALETELHL